MRRNGFELAHCFICRLMEDIGIEGDNREKHAKMKIDRTYCGQPTLPMLERNRTFSMWLLLSLYFCAGFLARIQATLRALIWTPWR